MTFPEKYIKHGKFRLHSGENTDIFYDVNAMLTDFHYRIKIIKMVNKCYGTHVGISTGGAIIASWYEPWAMIKDGELKGKILPGGYCLIDDVCTTENSIREAIKIIGKKPKKIFIMLDRRKNRNLKIESLYEV